jgi:hypothetical protein
MSPYESHIQIFSLRDTKSFSFIFQLSLIFRLFDFFFDFYQRPQRPRWPPLNGPLCLTYSLFVLELLTVCRLASWPSVAWPPDRLSPGLLTVCRLAYWPSVAWPPDRLSPGLLTVCRLASWPSAPASWAGPPFQNRPWICIFNIFLSLCFCYGDSICLNLFYEIG